MAIDSEAKRKSVLAISYYALGPVIIPDGTIGAFDRQTIGYGYGGISAGGAPAGIVLPIFAEAGMSSVVFGGLIIR